MDCSGVDGVQFIVDGGDSMIVVVFVSLLECGFQLVIFLIVVNDIIDCWLWQCWGFLIYLSQLLVVGKGYIVVVSVYFVF